MGKFIVYYSENGAGPVGQTTVRISRKWHTKIQELAAKTGMPDKALVDKMAAYVFENLELRHRHEEDHRDVEISVDAFSYEKLKEAAEMRGVSVREIVSRMVADMDDCLDEDADSPEGS